MAGTLRDRIRDRLSRKYERESVSDTARSVSGDYSNSTLDSVSRRMSRTASATEARERLEADFKIKEETARKIAESTRPKFGGDATLSAPGSITLAKPADKYDSSLTRAEQLNQDYKERQKANGVKFRNTIRNELKGLGTFIFGESEESMEFGETGSYRGIGGENEPEGFVAGLRGDVKNRGILKFLYENVTMTDEAKIRNNIAEAQTIGRTREEGVRNASLFEQEKYDEMDQDVLAHFRARESNRVALSLVELLDFTPFISGFAKSGGKTVVRQALSEAMVARDAVEARKIFERLIPDTKGTQALEDMVALSQRVRDPAQADQLLKEIVEAADGSLAQSSTEAQKVLYQNGVPVVRGGAASGNVSDLVNIRDEVAKAVKGEMEGRRLSVDEILSDELKAGSLKFGTQADGKIDVFTTRNVSNPSLGERVALTESVAKESLAGGANTNKISVKVDDLVRMDDGTFVYAPKKAVTTEFTPQIKAVQEQSRQRVLEAEKMKKELARETKAAETQLAEAERRIANKQAEARRVKNQRELAAARETVENSKKTTTKLINDIDAKKDIALEAAVKANVTAKKEIAKQQSKLKGLLSSLKKIRAERNSLPAKTKSKKADVINRKTPYRKEKLPDELEQEGLELKLEKEAVDNHPAAGLKTFIKKSGEFKGTLDEGSGGLDSMLSEVTDGAYDTLEEARAGFNKYLAKKQDYETSVSVLKDKKAAWQAGKKEREAAQFKLDKKEKIDELEAARQEQTKKLITSEKAIKEQISATQAALKETTESSGKIKTKAQLRAELNRKAKAEKAAIKSKSDAELVAAKVRLTEAGLPVVAPDGNKPLVKIANEIRKDGGTKEDFLASFDEFYHGTPSKFDEFDMDKAGSNTDPGMLGKGAYFASKEITSTQYSKEGGEIMKRFLTYQNPKRITDYSQIPDVPGDGMVKAENLTNYWRSKGYDGVIDATVPGAEQAMVFDKSVIKTRKQLSEIWDNSETFGVKPKPPVVEGLNKAKGEYKQGVKEVGQFEKSIPNSPTGTLGPIESDGKLLSSKMNEDIARRIGYEDGVPEKYRELNLGKDQQIAVKMVVENPIAVYRKFIAGEKFTEASRASIGNALISHPDIASSSIRLQEVYRGLKGTRDAQEFVARKNIADLDVVNFINNLNDRGGEILTKRGVDLDKEVNKAWKAMMDGKTVEQKAISKQSVEKVLKNNLC
jgi:hypothetical protein